MRLRGSWAPSKYVLRQQRLAPTRDNRELSASSSLMAQLICDFYNEIVPRFVTGDLLDLGCGKQPLFELYRQFANTITATDWPTTTHSNVHLDFFTDLNHRLPLADNCMDTVILSDVLEHIADPSLVLAEVWRILRPGGHVLVNTPFLYQVHEAPHDYYRYTQFGMSHLVSAAGFDIQELRTLGGALDAIADQCGKLIHRFLGASLARVIQVMTYRVGNFGLGAQLRMRTTARMPLGIALVARKSLLDGRPGSRTNLLNDSIDVSS